MTPGVASILDGIIDDAVRLFDADGVGVWLWNAERDYPFDLAATRDVPDEIVDYVAGLPPGTLTPGLRAIRSESVVAFADATDPAIDEGFRDRYVRSGISSVCFVPLAFRGEPQGLVVLYHRRRYAWIDADIARAGDFADTAAGALGNARLVASIHSLAARLRAVQDLAARLNGLTDVRDIGAAIVDEIGTLSAFDTVRVYAVDRAGGSCEPIAFQGVFMGTSSPTNEMLRVPIGVGLTGWVAEHNEPLMTGDARADSRGLTVGSAAGPESMLVVPMAFEHEVRGVIVLSRLGRARFGPDDLTSLTIFAGYAAQAIVSAERLERLHSQQAELEHQLAGQRRLMAVNERLLSTLDAAGVLDLIADSLKAVVSYDALTIYRVDMDRQVRRPVIARDRFADVILGYEAPLGSGITGWAVEHREAVLANDAMLDPRAVQIPGTPAEPEALIVVPLIVEGEVLGSLNVARIGEVEAHFTQNEFELTKLFAAQAAIALRNAETHGEVRVQAEHDALTGLRNHGAFQREVGAMIAEGQTGPFAVLMMDLDRFKGYNDSFGHPAGDLLLAAVARAIEASVRSADRAYRYGGDEFAVLLPDSARSGAEDVATRIRDAVAAIRDPHGSSAVTISIGIACHPDDGADKDALVESADVALYVAKGSRLRSGPRDPLAAALDETTGALLEGGSAPDMLQAILGRAGRLLGTPHAYLYLLGAEGSNLEVHAGVGLFDGFVGHTITVDEGLAGAVYRSGHAVVVDDYRTYDNRQARFNDSPIGAVVGVPLTARGRVVGVIGVAAGPGDRRWHEPEVDALSRFAQLASIALEQARLQREAERSPLDPLTGLPARETLIAELTAALAGSGLPDSSAATSNPSVAVILMDIDRFKLINESLGVHAGDQVLAEVGRRIGREMGTGDLVARIGGDEFGILLRSGDADRAEAVARAILAALAQPFDLDGRRWFVSASFGFAAGRSGIAEAAEVLRDAEVALVQAQADPISRVARFDPVRSRETRARIELEADLRAGLARDELTAHYQPIVDLRTGRIVGFEALARWQHPTRGAVPPATFIPLAEETDLIHPLGAMILEKACRQARAWRDRWPRDRLVMSVNLSSRQFADPHLVASIAAILETTGLDPTALELELTETVVMDRSADGLKALTDLRSLGVRLVLDDFGTGYSSLAYLRQLPLDTIKIDRSFVTELDEADPNVAIVQAVLSLAHGLGISVVAEGIETPEQAARLRELGCDMGQGYAWARPQPADRATAMLAAGSGQRRLPSSRSRNRNRLTKSR